MTPSTSLSIATGSHLKLPFFSRSSSSFLSSAGSRGSFDTDSEVDHDYDHGGDAEVSPPLPITPATPHTPAARNRDRSGRGAQEQREPRSRSPTRPGLRKMPSWTSVISRRSSSTTRDADGDGEGGGSGVMGHQLMRKVASLERTRLKRGRERWNSSRTGTTRSSVIQFDDLDSVDVARTDSDAGWSTMKEKGGSARLSLSRGSISQFFRSSISTSPVRDDRSDVNVVVSEAAKTRESALPFPPPSNYSTLRAKRGALRTLGGLDTLGPSDETRARTERTHEPESDSESYLDSERARRGSDWPPSVPRPLNIDLSGIPTFAAELEANFFSIADTASAQPTSNATRDANVDDPVADGTGFPIAQKRASGGRSADTPLTLPVMPKLNLGRSTFVPPTVLESPVIDSLSAVVSHLEAEKSERITAETPAQPIFDAKLPADPRETEESPAPADETVTFDLNIFSPRPPARPILRGLIDSMPISPLELPCLRSIKADYPSPLIPRNAPSSPVQHQHPSPMNDSTGLHRSNARSVRPLPQGSNLPRSAERRGSHASISGLPKRRTSIIIRPSVLPCPTPPSLLTSPKSLGSEYIPSLFSPSTTSPITSKFASTGSLSRRGRGSLRLHLGAKAGLGMMSPFTMPSNAGSPYSFTDRATPGAQMMNQTTPVIEHVPTPGTFGLEGEAERLVGAGINPYFA